jgi:antitoxin (DNA-binding transcriptional repressor) of toxin-antitoxin stability system
MMTTVSTEEVKQNLPSLLARLKTGESMVIEQDGKAVATLLPVTVVAKREFGFMAGQFEVPEDFNEMGREEIEEMFYGKP